MKVYRMGPDMVVAKNQPDAWAIWMEHQGGYAIDDIDADEEFEPVPHGTRLAILVDINGEVSDSGDRLELPASEWVRREGRGFLCSTEF